MQVDVQLSWWVAAISIFVIFVIPVKFAGDFIEVRRVGFIPAAFSLMVGIIAALGSSFLVDSIALINQLSTADATFMFSKTALIIFAFLFSFKYVLCTTFSSSIGVFIIAVFLSLVFSTAICSFEIYRSGVSGFELFELLKGAIRVYIN